ncbi:DNA-binding response regulator [Streptomyces sp. NPDC057702]|uniref:response regulator transcription factor n=1 Tax=unclassified Streptomyces TaxID=2593676 RepID=UPI0036BF9B20
MIKLLIAEDMHLIRGALVALLNQEDDLSVVAEVERGDLIVDAVARHRPDVALIDIDLPGLDGISAAALVRQQQPECQVLIVSGHGQPGTLRRALSARVSGYLLKDSPPRDLAQAVRKVHAGQRAIDPHLAMMAWEGPESPFTTREAEVLQLAAQGAPAAEIASLLSLSVGTVRNYLASIVSKTNGRNRVDAIRIAEDSGWLV